MRAGCGVPGDLRRAAARSRDGRPVPAAVRGHGGGAVRAGAGVVRPAGHGQGRDSRGGRHEDRGVRVEGREPDRRRGCAGSPARWRRGTRRPTRKRTPCSGTAGETTTRVTRIPAGSGSPPRWPAWRRSGRRGKRNRPRTGPGPRGRWRPPGPGPRQRASPRRAARWRWPGRRWPPPGPPPGAGRRLARGGRGRAAPAGDPPVPAEDYTRVRAARTRLERAQAREAARELVKSLALSHFRWWPGVLMCHDQS